MTADDRHWCEHCDSLFDRPHHGADGTHLAGVEYGGYGRRLALEAAARELAAAVQPLLDRDVLVPFWSAWEIDTHAGADGEKLHERMAVAHGKMAALLGDDA